MPLHLALGRLTAGVRRLAARRRLLRWIPIAACCAGLVATVHARIGMLDEERSRWSDTRAVWLAVVDHAPGDEIVAEEVEVPLVAVPADAATKIPDGAVALQRVGRGEIVTDADLAAAGPLALVPAGHRALAVRESVESGAEVGERVDVVTDGVVVAHGARVVGTVGDAVLVAVAADDAPAVALANDAGVTLLRAAAGG